MSKQLITGFQPLLLNESNIREAKNPTNKLIVPCILQRGNAFNQNKRYYPIDILKREIDKYTPKVNERKALGELDHPETSVINLTNVSHLVCEIGWNGNDVVGKLEILPTPAGNIVKSLITSRVNLGVSSRGLGSVKDLGDGKVEVQEDYELIGFDIVSDPSTQGAWLSINESVDVKSRNILTTYHNIDLVVKDILSDFYKNIKELK